MWLMCCYLCRPTREGVGTFPSNMATTATINIDTSNEKMLQRARETTRENATQALHRHWGTNAAPEMIVALGPVI